MVCNRVVLHDVAGGILRVLRCRREASEHFLSALDQQRQGNTPDGRRSTMSDSIWRTLRTCMVMNGADPKLIALVDDLKLDSLLKELGVQPV